MVQRMKWMQRLLRRYEKKQQDSLSEKEENYYFRETEALQESEAEDTNQEEYEILEREIAPRRIKCPDCGGVTLEGLEFCDKCGGELTHTDS